MKRLSELVFLALFLVYLTPAHAMLNVDTGIEVCQVFAADDSGKGKDGKDKQGDGKEEEEPDCE